MTSLMNGTKGGSVLGQPLLEKAFHSPHSSRKFSLPEPFVIIKIASIASVPNDEEPHGTDFCSVKSCLPSKYTPSHLYFTVWLSGKWQILRQDMLSDHSFGLH